MSETLRNHGVRGCRSGPWTVTLTAPEETRDSASSLEELQAENIRLERQVAELRLRNILLEEVVSRRG